MLDLSYRTWKFTYHPFKQSGLKMISSSFRNTSSLGWKFIHSLFPTLEVSSTAKPSRSHHKALLSSVSFHKRLRFGAQLSLRWFDNYCHVRQNQINALWPGVVNYIDCPASYRTYQKRVVSMVDCTSISGIPLHSSTLRSFISYYYICRHNITGSSHRILGPKCRASAEESGFKQFVICNWPQFLQKQRAPNPLKVIRWYERSCAKTYLFQSEERKQNQMKFQ